MTTPRVANSSWARIARAVQAVVLVAVILPPSASGLQGSPHKEHSHVHVHREGVTARHNPKEQAKKIKPQKSYRFHGGATATQNAGSVSATGFRRHEWKEIHLRHKEEDALDRSDKPKKPPGRRVSDLRRKPEYENHWTEAKKPPAGGPVFEDSPNSRMFSPLRTESGFTRLVENNLGGRGPGVDGVADTEDMRFVIGFNNLDIEGELLVENISEYLPLSVDSNGLINDMGIINIAAGTDTNLFFTFVFPGTNTPITIPQFEVVLLDMDAGKDLTAIESMSVPEPADGLVYDLFGPNNSVNYTDNNGEHETPHERNFSASEIGTALDNPDDGKNLTALQKRRCVGLYYEDVSYFAMDFAVSPGKTARNFMFTVQVGPPSIDTTTIQTTTTKITTTKITTTTAPTTSTLATTTITSTPLPASEVTLPPEIKALAPEVQDAVAKAIGSATPATPAPSPKPTTLTRAVKEGAPPAEEIGAGAVAIAGTGETEKYPPRWWPVDAITMTFTSAWLAYGINHAGNIAGGSPVTKLEVALHGGSRAVEITPMLCVLFVNVAGRANLITDGYLFALSPSTLRNYRVQEMPRSMRIPDFGVNAGLNIAEKVAAICLLVAMCTRCCGEYSEARVVERFPDDPGRHREDVVAPAWKERSDVYAQAYRFAVLIMYVFILVLIFGGFRMVLSDNAESAELPGLWSGTGCTFMLCAIFFPVYLMYWILEDTNLIGHRFGAAVAKLAVLAVNFAPIFGILFLTLEYGGMPQSNLKSQRQIATACIAFLVILALMTPNVMTTSVRDEAEDFLHGSRDGDLLIQNRGAFMMITISHWVTIVILYVVGWRLAGEIWHLPQCPKILFYLTMMYLHLRLLIWAIPMLVQCFYRHGPDLWVHKSRANRLIGLLKDFAKILPMLAAYTLGWWLFAPY